MLVFECLQTILASLLMLACNFLLIYPGIQKTFSQLSKSKPFFLIWTTLVAVLHWGHRQTWRPPLRWQRSSASSFCSISGPSRPLLAIGKFDCQVLNRSDRRRSSLNRLEEGKGRKSSCWTLNYEKNTNSWIFIFVSTCNSFKVLTEKSQCRNQIEQDSRIVTSIFALLFWFQNRSSVAKNEVARCVKNNAKALTTFCVNKK